MAEEKKTKAAPKKTAAKEVKKATPKKTVAKAAPKKEVVKEVKAEKKFCTNCGKELNEGEVCSCQVKAVNVNTDALTNNLKDFWELIKNSFKKPSTTIKEETNKGNVKHALIVLVVIALSYGLYTSGAFASIIDVLGGVIGTSISSNIDIPYFKIFIYMSLINFIVAFIPITITFLAGKMSHNKDFDYKKAICLYSYSMVPTIAGNLLMAVLYYLNILSWLGALIGMIVGIVTFFNYIFSYIEMLGVSDNKKSYVVTAVIVGWVVAALLLSLLLAGSLVKDVAGDVTLKKTDTSSVYDSFNW